MLKTQLRLTFALAIAALVAGFAPAPVAAEDCNEQLQYLLAPHYRLIHGDLAAGIPDTLVFNPDKHLNLFKDIGALNADGTVNAVIEIPQGTNAKWETDVVTGRLFWEIKKGAKRVVAYLGYPTNYGMAPRTIGEDGDPLDVLVLGKMELRGAISKARIVGVMRMIDGGDLDDKLIAVLDGTSFAGMTMADLEANGVLSILKTWFESYKGPGEITVPAFEGEAAAMATLQVAMAKYLAAYP
jgi:inorganic pyrophosphatase